MTRSHLVACFVPLLTTGCVSNWGQLAIVSTRIPHSDYELVAPEARGEDCAYSLLGVPLGSPSLERAIDSAVSSVPGGQMMSDLSIERSAVGIILVARVCLSVTGQVRALQ